MEPVLGGAQNRRECLLMMMVSDSTSQYSLLRAAKANDGQQETIAGRSHLIFVTIYGVHIVGSQALERCCEISSVHVTRGGKS